MQKTIYGYKIRTTNLHYQSTRDMGELWEKFLSENPEMNEKIFVVYTNYQNKDQEFYDVYIGLEKNLQKFSEKIVVSLENYKIFESEYHSPDDIMEIWKNIWQDPELHRKYSYDVEEYDFKNNIVKLYLSVE